MVNLSPGHFITTEGIDYQKNIFFHSEYDGKISGTYPAFDLPDTEIFLNQRFSDENRKVLFGFSNADGSRMQPTSGWYRQSGRGLVFYYQAGHSAADFENRNFIRVLVNTLEWEPE
jgi:type 1 glutamine amidotransferase